jgi:crotonobetainyl-CoA:carnitine CoA-transferase CaiB-like acyl-CoA transferase
MGGFMSITGGADGTPREGPQKVGVAVVDLLTGLYGVVGILAALQNRDRTGTGQYIDLALLDVEVACLANQGLNYLITGDPPRRMGNAHPSIVPYQDFPTSDGAMMVAVGNDAQFQRFCSVLGETAWAHDSSYVTNHARVRNRVDLVSKICTRTRTRATKDWIVMLESVNVPCGPINDIGDVFQDQQVLARGLQMRLAHASAAGTVPSVASPLRLSETPVEYRRAPPLLGQHTAEILCGELGFTQAEVAELARKGVIAGPVLTPLKPAQPSPPHQ